MLVIALLAMAIAAAGVYYGRRAVLLPKRRITISQGLSASLVSDSYPGVTVFHNQKELDGPFVTPVTVGNTGKRAISSADFDQSRPIDINLGVPVIAILKVGADRWGSKLPEFQLKDTSLWVGPDLFAKGKAITWVLLTEGRPKLECTGYLIDVSIATSLERSPYGAGENWRSKEEVWQFAVAAVASVVGIAASVMAALLTIDG